MFKEIVIIIVVIALVISLDIVSNNYTKSAVEELSQELNILKEYILEENKEKAEKQMEEINDIWEEKYNVLAYYIEHDELEKVKTELTKLSADLSIEEYKYCIAELDTTIFILEHIKQKEEFDIKSIF